MHRAGNRKCAGQKMRGGSPERIGEQRAPAPSG